MKLLEVIRTNSKKILLSLNYIIKINICIIPKKYSYLKLYVVLTYIYPPKYCTIAKILAQNYFFCVYTYETELIIHIILCYPQIYVSLNYVYTLCKYFPTVITYTIFTKKAIKKNCFLMKQISRSKKNFNLTF